MGQVRATLMDLADIRAYECTLPDDVPVSNLAGRLAKLIHMPAVGPDNLPLSYGLIIRGGKALNPDATLAAQGTPKKLTLRIVPQVTVSQENTETECEPAAEMPEDDPDPPIEIAEPTALLHDVELGARPDVRIDARVHKEIEEFASRDRNAECAGLLLGAVIAEGKSRVVHVAAIAPAKGAPGTRSSVRLTADAWEEMLRVRDSRYSELRVLGWFHTHVGWGVFMSDADVFFHRHFFPHPNMLSYVLDPTTGRDGFFFWHEGKISLCPSFGIVGTPEEVGVGRGRKLFGKGSRPDIRDVVIALLVVLCMYLAFSRPMATDRAATKMHAPAKVTHASQKKPKAAAIYNGDLDRAYTVGANENLWGICVREYKNGGLAQALAKYNGLARSQDLMTGQEIKLPPEDVLREQRWER